MPATIVSLCDRAEKGVSRPFLCEADDGHFYFVKSDNVSADQLVIEYVFSRLGEECGLPVAPVEIVEIPEELARYALVAGADEFRPGLAFGSRRIDFADEIRTAHLARIDEEIRMRCLCFDWWARNPDRRLGVLGGDPNLLWDPVRQAAFLVDHDGCLDPDFDEEEFVREHVFHEVRPFLERGFFEKWRTKFESAIYNLESIWSEIPESWLRDESGVDRVTLTRAEIEAALIKPELPADGILPG